mgnify:CR=1 FL=1
MNSKSPIFTAQSDVALRIHVDRAVRHYFAQLQGEQPSQVYDMVLAEMEKPLLSVVLDIHVVIKRVLQKFLDSTVALYVKS